MKFLSSEEVNFYVELAVDECERWIQRVTREPFLDHEDFLYSLRYGTHLRRLINFIFPSSFHFSKLVPSTSKSVFSAVGLSIEDLPLVDDDDWVVQFLLICLYRLRIPESDLFYAEDLIDFEDSSSEVIDEYLKRVDGGCRSLNDRLRRVCLTISALSSRISHSRPHIPQFDNSAVEPLAEYHSFVIRSQSSERENHLIFDRPTLAVVECLKEIIDKTVASSSLPSTSSRSLNVYAMDSAEYKVNRFLQDLGGEQTDATDDFSYSSLSRSSALGGVDHLKEITTIPTRVQQKISSLPPSDPLHFVSVHSGGLTLAEHAKQMMSVTETQRRQRQQELENMPRSADDEESWMADLDTWRRKRKQKKTGESIESYQPTTTTTNLANKSKDQKDEILHISSPYQEVDSGIERTSPSTSLDFSPRSDLKSSTSDYASPSNLRSTSHGYDRQRSETPPPDHAPPPPPVEEHIYSESERQRAREKLDQVLIEVAVPKNRRQTLEEEFPSPPPQYKPIETAAYYDGSRFREESARVETVLHVPTETQRVDQNLRIEEDRYSNDSEKSVLVELTVELNREQIGKVSTQYPIPPESNRTSDRRRPSLTYQYSSSTPERSRSLERYERRELSDYEMAPPVGTIYKTVDIPFDDSSISAYQPKQRDSKSGDGSFSLVLDMGSQPVHKGFGFSVSGVRSPTIRVETVVVDTPADRGGLQVGDQLISINGESVADQYPSAISRMLHEAARLGEAELRLVRRDNVKLTVSATNSQRSNNSFDKTRNMFQDAVQDTSVSSFSEFKKRHSVGSVKSGNVSRRDSQSTITPSSSFGDVIRGNGLERSSTDNSTELYRTPVQSFRDLPIRNSDVILNRDALDRDVGFRKSYGTEGVKTVVDRSHPGKLSDFIPEVERAAAVAQGEHAWDERRREMESAIAQRSSEDVPRIMRNYDLRPTQSINPSYERRNSDEDSVSAVMTRSTLPRNTSGKAFNDYDNEETVVEDGRSYLRSEDIYPKSEPVPILKKRSQSDVTHRDYYERREERITRETTTRQTPREHFIPITVEDYGGRSKSASGYYRIPEQVRRSESYDSIDRDDYFERHPMTSRPRSAFEPSEYENLPRSGVKNGVRYEEYNYREIGRSKEYPVVLAREPEPDYVDIPVNRVYDDQRIGEDDRYDYPPAEDVQRKNDSWKNYRTRSKSSDNMYSRYADRYDYPPEEEENSEGISGVSHNFYDRHGRRVDREQSKMRNVEITRSYDKNLDRDEWKEDTDPREWRSVIKSQRQPAPGQPISTERLQPTTQSLSNLPAIINKRMREQEEKYKREQEITDRENKYYGIDYSRQEQQQKQQRLSDQMSHQNERPRTMERQRRDFSEERREEKYNTPIYSLQHTPSADDYRSPTNGYRSQTLDRTPPSGSDYRAPNTINATTGSDRNLASIYTPNTVTKPTREAPVTPTAATRSMPEKTDSRSSNPQITKPTTVPTSNVSKSDPKTEKDNVVAVSGKHRCAHCDNELGRGQAMIIESLNLYYHLTCFKCFVCNTPLGNGQKGADVRVREGRLHCKSCYSNDQVQLSKV